MPTVPLTRLMRRLRLQPARYLAFTFVTLFVLTQRGAQAQPDSGLKIFTSDISNFWQAYDEVLQTPDTARHAELIQTRYLDKGTEGLKNLLMLRKLNARTYVRAIHRYPEFWKSVRARTLDVLKEDKLLMPIMEDFRRLYPDFKRPDIYFSIGCITTGGTTQREQILIGTEIMAADSTVDATGLSDSFQVFFRDNQGITFLVTHEAVHTQQKGGDQEKDWKMNLLGACIREGACEFVTELLLRQDLKAPYMVYGRQHEAAVWQAFKTEMYGEDLSKWLYNGSKAEAGKADLGYFVGYAICKAYYQEAKDKKKAIAEIIGLDCTDASAVQKFLIASRYAR